MSVRAPASHEPQLFGGYGDDDGSRRSWLVATFGSTAIDVAIVKTWKYEPALAQGQPITVCRVIQIPFKLTA